MVVFELPNYTNAETMVIELFVGGTIALGIFVFQTRISKRVNDFILQTAELEKNYKNSQCQRIIEILKDIEDRENKVKETLNKYKIGNPTNELSNYFMEAMVSNFKYKIGKMNNAIWKLQGKLNDAFLAEEFSEYLGWFNFLPMRILIDKIPQQARQAHEIDGVISGINKQLERIQEFVVKFTQEIDSSLTDKHEDDQSGIRGSIDQSKYFIAPKLNKLIC